MEIQAIKTHRVEVGDSLLELLDQYISSISKDTVVAIAAKVISLCEGRVVDKKAMSKKELIWQEAEMVAQGYENSHGTIFTIKKGILLPSAGIDESNANDSYILYPINIQRTATKIWHYLRERHKVERLGVLITDSHTTPTRRGVIGITLGWCGFSPINSYLGTPDLYGRPLRVSQANVLDSLAASAVFSMGEGNEQTPLAILKSLNKVHFMSRAPTPEEENSIRIPINEDLYSPFLLGVKWVKPSKPGQ